MVYRPHEFAKLIGKSVSTLRRWDSEGKLRAKRSIRNQRYYDEHDLQKALNLPTKIEERKTIVYCRVSSRGQLDDLKSQEKAMETYCLNAGISIDEWICEIGGRFIKHNPYFFLSIIWVKKLLKKNSRNLTKRNQIIYQSWLYFIKVIKF